MNEVVKVELNGKQYIRWNARIYTTDGSEHEHGLRAMVNDKATIDALEGCYGDMQRQHASKGSQAPIISGYTPPAVRSKGLVTPREKRANGRAE